MKTCTTCREAKPLGEFHNDKNSRDGKCWACKSCRVVKSAQHYAENKERIDTWQNDYYAKHRDERLAYQRSHNAIHGARIQAERRAREQARREILDDLKAERGCAECGEDDPVCLHWHHRDGEAKSFAVGDAIRQMSVSMDEILAEIEKCDCLCANHHLKHHARRRSHMRTGWA